MPFPNAGTVDTQTPSGTKDFVFGKMATQQSTNIAAGDHLKFDTSLASSGNSAVLDTSTAYVTTIGAAAIGRVSLKANRRYRLRCDVPYILGSGATGLLDIQFYDATGNAATPGSVGTRMVSTTATNDDGGSAAESVFTPGQDSLVEVRIVTATALSQIGHTTNRHPTLFVETI